MSLINLLPSRILYPPVQSTAWVVISRLAEAPTRTVSNLSLVDSVEEFALPFPTGRFPSKYVSFPFSRQAIDALNRPLYDDGSPSGTSATTDISGNSLPPKMVSDTEQRLVSLQEYPELFTLAEVYKAVQDDFLAQYPLYKWTYLTCFDDRTDSASVYQGQQEVSGFGSGGHPLFFGPIQGEFDASADPAGHLLLVAPPIHGVNYYFQIRHGVSGTSGHKGPLLDLSQASRNGGVANVYPMQDLVVTQAMLTDQSGAKVTHFWIRTAVDGTSLLERPYPVIPWIMILGRPTGSPGTYVST